MERPKRTKQKTLTEMYPKRDDPHTNPKPKSKEAIDPPVSFDVFKKMVQNLPAIVSKYNQNKATSSSDSGEQFYRDFYSNPEIRILYPLIIKPCPSSLRNKLLQIPGEFEQHYSPLNNNEDELVRPTNSLSKRKDIKRRPKKKYIYPVTFETFKKYLDHKELMKDVLWRISNKNKKEWKRLYKDEDYYEKTLKLYYKTFYLAPNRRHEYDYKFKETSPEFLKKLLSHAVVDHDKETYKPDKKIEKTDVISEEINTKEDNLIREEHTINSSFRNKSFEKPEECVIDELFTKASNYDVFLEQAELINQRLSLPITDSKFKHFLVNMDEIYDEIARRNPFVTTKTNASKIVFHEFYRLFYLFPEFRSFYNCRYKVCPLRVKENILKIPINFDFSGILFPITISTFKEFINYDEILDKLIKSLVAKDEKGFSIAKNDEKLCQRIFEAYYYSYYLSPHIVRGLFSNKLDVTAENVSGKLLDMPILRPAGDVDTSCSDLTAIDNNNQIHQTQAEHDEQNTTSKLRYCDVDFPVSIEIFKKYINYNNIMDAIIKNLVKNDEHKYMKLRKDNNICRKHFVRFYSKFYLKENFRKNYQVTFENAPPEIQDKLLEFATIKKKTRNAVTEVLNNVENDVDKTKVSKLFNRESARQESSGVEIISVINLKPIQNPSPDVELAERIYFQNVSLHHNIEYLIYTSNELNQCIWEAVDVITYEDFQSITGIYNATELYDSNFRLRRFYRYVAEQKNWPVNLYIKMKYFVSFFQSKGVPLLELDLNCISPKLFYWHELLQYTNFKDCVHYDFLKHNNKPIEVIQESDFIVECERYYNRCWTHNKWISQTPHVTDLNLTFQNKDAQTKRKKNNMKCPGVVYLTFQAESDIENTHSNNSQINESSQSSTYPSHFSALLPAANNPTQQVFKIQMEESDEDDESSNNIINACTQSKASQTQLNTTKLSEMHLPNEFQQIQFHSLDYNSSILESAASNPLTENVVSIQNITSLQRNFQENKVDPLEKTSTYTIVNLSETSNIANNLEPKIKIYQQVKMDNLCTLLNSDTSNESMIVINNSNTMSDKDFHLLCVNDECNQPINIASSKSNSESFLSETECAALADDQLMVTDLMESHNNECSENNTLMIEAINSESLIIIDDDSTENNTDFQLQYIDDDNNSQESVLLPLKSNETPTSSDVKYVALDDDSKLLFSTPLEAQRPVEIVIERYDSESSKSTDYTIAARKAAKARQKPIFLVSKKRKN